ncbi:DoxX family protein [Ruania suaedae]|nr:DoxX family protein [Ruania suaedae]
MRRVSRWFGGAGLRSGIEELRRAGLRGGALTALVVGGGQVLAGVLFVSGALTSIAVMSATGVMLVAATVKAKNGLWLQRDGREFAFVLIVTSVAPGFTGPGAYSADALLGIASIPAWTGLMPALAGLLAGLSVCLAVHVPTMSSAA